MMQTYIQHRLDREKQIAACFDSGLSTPAQIVEIVYKVWSRQVVSTRPSVRVRVCAFVRLRVLCVCADACAQDTPRNLWPAAMSNIALHLRKIQQDRSLM